MRGRPRKYANDPNAKDQTAKMRMRAMRARKKPDARSAGLPHDLTASLAQYFSRDARLSEA
jgi:hypothetical protein